MNTKGNLVAGFTFICFAILIPPFTWHCRNRNIPAATLIFWLMFSNITAFIGAVIWSAPDFYNGYQGEGYCDIVIKVDSASSAGKLCASAALSLQLFLILKGASPSLIDNKSWRKKLLDLSICFATPIFIMSTSYIVQYQRIGVVSYYGCVGIYASSWLTNVLVNMWQLVWSCFAMVCATLTIVTYFRKRRDAKDLLKCTNSGLNLKRFAKLLAFSVCIILGFLPLSVVNFIMNQKTFRGPFVWSEIHHEYWGETAFLEQDPKFFYDKWVSAALSVVVFILFGLGSDAVNMYKIFLIDIKADRIFNIKDPRSTNSFGVAEQTRTSTNGTGKSEFTMNSAYTGNTITDGIDVEFNKMMGDYSAEAPDSADTKRTTSYTVDLEKFEKGDVLEYNIDDDSREELEYIMNMASDSGHEIDFSYNMTQKQ